MHKERDQLYSEDSKKLAKSSFAAIGGVFLSRASGVIRTIVVNSSFGAGVALDSFNAAFRFPNALRDLFADGALSSAFIKVLVDAREISVEAEKKLISIVIGFFLTITLIIGILCAIYSLEFMTLISNDSFKNSGGLLLSSSLFKILAFYLPITMLNAIAMASLGILGKTFRATNGSLFLSVGMILGCFVFAPAFHSFQFNSIFGLAFGAMLGAFLQLIYQFIPLIKLNLILMPNFNIIQWSNYKPLKEVLILMTPRAIGQGALSIALLINTMFAIQVGSGVLTYIVTAITIIQVPVGLFGVATGFAALPMLTKIMIEKNYTKFSKILVDSIDTSLWLSMLTSLGFALCIVPFYRLVFEHGKISFHDTIQNCVAVCAYSIGILFSAGSKILVNSFFSINKTKQIITNSFFYLTINAMLSSYLAPRYGIIGLGLSYGTSTCCDFFMNLYFFKRTFKKVSNNVSPYNLAGKNFIPKIFIFSVLSYTIGILGINLTIHFWNNFENIFHHTLTSFMSFIILSVIVLIYGLFCIVILKIMGPQNLKNLINSNLKYINKMVKK